MTETALCERTAATGQAAPLYRNHSCKRSLA